MNTPTPSTKTDYTLLILGIASFFLYPFTAIPGIVIGKRQAVMSTPDKIGYRLCWICMGLFCVHLLIVTALLLQGRAAH